VIPNPFYPPEPITDLSPHPRWGIIRKSYPAAPDTFNGRTVSTTPVCTYDLTLYTSNGPLVYSKVTPSQNRWDSWFYPSPDNSIANVYWEENKMYFTVLEIACTEDC